MVEKKEGARLDFSRDQITWTHVTKKQVQQRIKKGQPVKTWKVKFVHVLNLVGHISWQRYQEKYLLVCICYVFVRMLL